MKRRKMSAAGFSLVEIIIVLLIISILSAALVPSLVGYIRQSRNAAYMQEAKLCVTGVQASLAEAYGFYPPDYNSKQIFGNNYSSTTDSKRDVICNQFPVGKEFANEVKNLFEKDPYMLVIGLGDYGTYKDTDFEKVYQTYVMFYWPDKNTYPLFYDGAKWIEKYPFQDNGGTGAIDKDNYLTQSDGTKIKLQFYFVTCPDNSSLDDCWNKLKDAAKK